MTDILCDKIITRLTKQKQQQQQKLRYRARARRKICWALAFRLNICFGSLTIDECECVCLRVSRPVI